MNFYDYNYLIVRINLIKGRKTNHHGPDIVGYRRATSFLKQREAKMRILANLIK